MDKLIRIRYRQADGSETSNRTLHEWGGWAAARRYALRHGEAGVIRANGRFTLLTRVTLSDQIRQKTWLRFQVVPHGEAL